MTEIVSRKKIDARIYENNMSFADDWQSISNERD